MIKTGIGSIQFGSRPRNPFLRSKSARRSSVSGQALLEYAILISFAATLSIGFSATFGKVLSTGIQTFNAVLEKELATGNFPQKDRVFGIRN